MSGLEIAALGALAFGYIDSRTQLVKDLNTIRGVVKAALPSLLLVVRKKTNFFYFFEQCVKTQGDKTFIVYPEPRKGEKIRLDQGKITNYDALFNVKSHTYKQVYDIVLKWSAVLYNQYGIRPGDTVAVDFVNKDEMVFVWFALWNLGAVPALINYNLRTKALEHCIMIAKCTSIIVDEEVADAVEEIEQDLTAKNVQSIYINDSFRQQAEKSEPLCLAEGRGTPDLSDAGCYIYTSGTTGLPKAAVVPWRRIYASPLYAGLTRMKGNDILYTAMPLYHSTAALLGFIAITAKGGTIAIGHRFSTSTFWTQVKLSKATIIQYVGETCRYLLSAPPHPDERNHHVRMACGNGIRPDVWQVFKKRFNIQVIDEFYGATEFPLIVTNHQRGEFGVGACGGFGSLIETVMESLRIAIVAVDPDTQDLYRDPKTGFCRRVKNNEPGEFLFVLPPKNIKKEFQGYTGNEKASKEKLVYNVFKKGDVYLKSGDLLRRNPDNFIYFVDRMGDTFRWKSENVSTNEVEEAIAEHRDIKQAVVVGIQVPQHEGRAGFAVVELNDQNRAPDLSGIAQHLRKRLPRYAVPLFLKVVGSIETTGNNKVQKAKFRDQKLPGQAETIEEIFWLNGDSYELFTPEDWDNLSIGKTKL